MESGGGGMEEVEEGVGGVESGGGGGGGEGSCDKRDWECECERRLREDGDVGVLNLTTLESPVNRLRLFSRPSFRLLRLFVTLASSPVPPYRSIFFFVSSLRCCKIVTKPPMAEVTKFCLVMVSRVASG